MDIFRRGDIFRKSIQDIYLAAVMAGRLEDRIEDKTEALTDT